MFPIIILELILLFALALLALYVYNGKKTTETHAQDIVREAFAKEQAAIVQVTAYNRDMEAIRSDIRRLKDFTRMPPEGNPQR